MKQLFIIAIIALGLTSCTKKCYHCDNGVGGQYHSELDVCDGDPWYDGLEDGVVYTDNVGNVYQCDKQ